MKKKCKAKTLSGKKCPAEGYISGYCLPHYKKELRKLTILNDAANNILQR